MRQELVESPLQRGWTEIPFERVLPRCQDRCLDQNSVLSYNGTARNSSRFRTMYRKWKVSRTVQELSLSFLFLLLAMVAAHCELSGM
jgi:hypothetical protein